MPDDTPTPEFPPFPGPTSSEEHWSTPSGHLSFSVTDDDPQDAGYLDEDPRFDGPYPAAVQVSRPAPVTERPRRNTGAIIGAALVAGILGAALSAAVVYFLLNDDGTAETAAPAVTIVERVETQIVSPDDSGPTAAAVASRVLPSIVTVEISDTEEFSQSGSGSGVVLDSDGLLITNHHVVEGAAAVRVVFADGRTYDAELIGSDELTDLAVISIDAVGLSPIELGSADDLAIGDMAIAVGSPLGLHGGPSVTVGVVSAFERRVRTSVDSQLFGMLQTDAPITRGSSGGALVDREGRLIGITTAIAVSDVGAEGLGFAIPVELVIRVTDDLIATGEATHAFLGITGATHFEQEDDGAIVPAGVIVESIIGGTAADEAGLEAGDIIRSFDEESLVTMEQLVVRLRFYRVGETVDLVVTRGQEDVTIELTLLERPEGV